MMFCLTVRGEAGNTTTVLEIHREQKEWVEEAPCFNNHQLLVFICLHFSFVGKTRGKLEWEVKLTAHFVFWLYFIYFVFFPHFSSFRQSN